MIPWDSLLYNKQYAVPDRLISQDNQAMPRPENLHFMRSDRRFPSQTTPWLDNISISRLFRACWCNAEASMPPMLAHGAFL